MKQFITLAGCGIALAVLSSGTPVVVRAIAAQASAGTTTTLEPDPVIYKHVSHLGWVVRDLDAIVNAWRALGVTDIQDAGVQEFPGVVYRGTPMTVRVRKAFARFDNGTIQWIQPLNEGTRTPISSPRMAREYSTWRSQSRPSRAWPKN